MDAERKFLYKELSYKVIGCLYEVYNELGSGHKEQIYQEALKIIFDEKRLEYKNNKKIKIRFRGREIGVYKPDFIIEDTSFISVLPLL